MLSKQTKDQIAREAQEKYPYLLSRPDLNHIKDKRRAAYIAGAETWAERGEVLKEALEEILVSANTKPFGLTLLKKMRDVAGQALSYFNNPVK